MSNLNGERELIFAVMKQAMIDGSDKQPSRPRIKDRALEAQKARKFVNSAAFDECCQFVGANVHILRDRYNADPNAVGASLSRVYFDRRIDTQRGDD